MVATKGQAITLAVISGLVIGCGIAVMVLFHSLFASMLDSGENLPFIAQFWVYGVPVLLVGVLGIVAAAVRNNAGVGVYMGICIVCLIVEAVFVVIYALIFFALMVGGTVARQCWLVDSLCLCTGVRPTGAPSCADPLVEAVNLAKAASALIVISWILMLSGAIVSCTACCCGQREDTVVLIGRPGYELDKAHY